MSSPVAEGKNQGTAAVCEAKCAGGHSAEVLARFENDGHLAQAGCLNDGYGVERSMAEKIALDLGRFRDFGERIRDAGEADELERRIE